MLLKKSNKNNHAIIKTPNKCEDDDAEFDALLSGKQSAVKKPIKKE